VPIFISSIKFEKANSRDYSVQDFPKQQLLNLFTTANATKKVSPAFSKADRN
jgi:hypothetical protein